MKRSSGLSLLVMALGCSVLLSATVSAAEIRVAVAANFTDVIKQLGAEFGKQSGHKVSVSSGATGKLYAQIKNGAPYDVFLAADEGRPTLLDEEGVSIADTRFTYALGTLVLWSADEALLDKGQFAKGQSDKAQDVLKKQAFSHISIANPKTAPYGRAAQQTLEKLGFWEQLQPKMVRGENIGQAYQYVYSENAQLGFVAKSQVFKDDAFTGGSYWEVPIDMYDPIVQQAVLLKDNAPARELLDYLRSPEAAAVIQSYGYSISE
ncbi:molybdate ABC transporter substrate-binding protein [Oceanisphaera profunda]|uniref:Molybdate ABC transporter substrate-binding protein n=1 Tax=Oceanisphaera profunda TaxID=1416627 RepID=A0A1Y0D2A9_9GAMM|nr:molybdate ABC transporter substrate-binding protein [Oceanisphaera profunda]ART81661.1 molybdate ABC transporter substrate-binding protein [Oceanisphaera profunda]